MIGFSRWWLKSILPERIMIDINNEREEGCLLRDEIVKEAPGMGYKTASFFMNKLGYKELVVIDVWMCRYLKWLGYDIELPDYKRKSGPNSKKYLFYEEIVQKRARKLGVEPAILQFTVWVKNHFFRIEKVIF